MLHSVMILLKLQTYEVLYARYFGFRIVLSERLRTAFKRSSERNRGPPLLRSCLFRISISSGCWDLYSINPNLLTISSVLVFTTKSVCTQVRDVILDVILCRNNADEYSAVKILSKTFVGRLSFCQPRGF